ncbi:MAG: hypothetical protein QJR13_00540 [Bacillota bacterium]|nr:hypothetical protein [Bacillota bacterium]
MYYDDPYSRSGGSRSPYGDYGWWDDKDRERDRHELYDRMMRMMSELMDLCRRMMDEHREMMDLCRQLREEMSDCLRLLREMDQHLHDIMEQLGERPPRAGSTYAEKKA